MDDLTAFLTARLDEDEQWAGAATPGPWAYNPGKMWLDGEAFETFDRSKGLEFVSYGGPPPFVGCVAATGPADHPQSMADAAHIARRDPARVLREVESRRAELADHALHDDGESCRRCVVWGFQLSLSPGPAPVVAAPVPFPCPTLRRLALPYADHADYREEWKP